MITRLELLSQLREGAVVRFWVKRHVGYDPQSDSDEYEKTYHQGVVTRLNEWKGEIRGCQVMYQMPGDLLPSVESASLQQITHILVEVEQKEK